jgi:hypothetical protein
MTDFYYTYFLNLQQSRKKMWLNRAFRFENNFSCVDEIMKIFGQEMWKWCIFEEYFSSLSLWRCSDIDMNNSDSSLWIKNRFEKEWRCEYWLYSRLTHPPLRKSSWERYSQKDCYVWTSIPIPSLIYRTKVFDENLLL